MAPVCKEVFSIRDMVTLLEDKGRDFWVSCLVGVMSSQLPDRVRTYRVEDDLAGDVFSHCAYMESADVKADADAILEDRGLGLRKGKVKSKSSAGCVFVFFNESKRPSALLMQRENLADNDKRLSAEERVRRTTMAMEVVDLGLIVAECTRYRSSFWVTNWQASDAEDAKRKAVISVMEGQPATERFKRCLFAEVRDCQQASQRLETACGMGLRRSKVKSKAVPGCVAVFFENEGRGQLAPVPRLADATPGPRAAAAAPRPRAAAAAQVPRAATHATVPAGADAAKRRRLEEAPAGGPLLPISETQQRPSAGRPEAAVASEELYYKQVTILEKRLGELLPKLPEDQLSTPFVQGHLEDLMQKPRGRFEKFRTDIARIWRYYLERKASDCPDLD